MLFSSHIFLFLFLPITLGTFCLLSRYFGPKPAKASLTLASLFFYGWWSPIYTLLIVASMLVNFTFGRRIGAEVKAGRSGMGWLTFAVTANLLLLGYFKYANFFVTNVNAVFGTHWSLGQIILPLGISFFTFTQIAYLVDVRRGVVCEYDLGDFLLFITFFPHLIAGPIIHHKEMMPQFREPKTYRFDWNNLAVGLAIFPSGFSKRRSSRIASVRRRAGSSISARPCLRCTRTMRGAARSRARSSSTLIFPATRTWRSASPGCSASCCR